MVVLASYLRDIVCYMQSGWLKVVLLMFKLRSAWVGDVSENTLGAEKVKRLLAPLDFRPRMIMGLALRTPQCISARTRHFLRLQKRFT